MLDCGKEGPSGFSRLMLSVLCPVMSSQVPVVGLALAGLDGVEQPPLLISWNFHFNHASQLPSRFFTSPTSTVKI